MNIQSPAPKIVYLDRDSLPARIEIPIPEHPHRWKNFALTQQSEVVQNCQDATIVATNKVEIGRDHLLACPSIQHIAVTATGYNVVDIEACKQLGVSVSNIPSYGAVTVSEHVIGCALSLRRELQRYRTQVIDGAWQQSPMFCLFDHPIQNLRGATFGVIGLGEIGLAAAKLAHDTGMKVIYHSRGTHDCEFATAVSLRELLTTSDVVSVHCSLNEATRDMIGATEIRSMKDSAILINTARGGIVNEDDAAKAITEGKLGGIAFDVMGSEPPQGDEALLKIANRSNVIITPHIAWASDQAMQHLAGILSKNIDAFLNGSPQNIVS